jgi:magnesium-transporting ATPase (P-type)
LWGRAKNPLNALLVSLATVSYFLGDIRAAIVIAIMVILAITTAFIQEHRSNNAAAKLRAIVKTIPQPIGLDWRGDAIGEVGGDLQGRDRGSFRSTEPLLHGR